MRQTTSSRPTYGGGCDYTPVDGLHDGEVRVAFLQETYTTGRHFLGLHESPPPYAAAAKPTLTSNCAPG